MNGRGSSAVSSIGYIRHNCRAGEVLPSACGIFAIAASQQIKPKWGHWYRRNIVSTFFLNMTTNASIIASCIVAQQNCKVPSDQSVHEELSSHRYVLVHVARIKKCVKLLRRNCLSIFLKLGRVQKTEDPWHGQLCHSQEERAEEGDGHHQIEIDKQVTAQLSKSLNNRCSDHADARVLSESPRDVLGVRHGAQLFPQSVPILRGLASSLQFAKHEQKM